MMLLLFLTIILLYCDCSVCIILFLLYCSISFIAVVSVVIIVIIQGYAEAPTYLIQVVYYNNPRLLFIPYTTDNSITYTATTVSRYAYSIVYSTLTILCLSITLLTLIIFLKKLFSYEKDWKKWLPEQKWAVCYFLALLLYINPIGVVSNLLYTYV